MMVSLSVHYADVGVSGSSKANVFCVYQQCLITWLDSFLFCLYELAERSHEGLAREALAAQLCLFGEHSGTAEHKHTLRRKIVLLCLGLIDKSSAQSHGRSTHLPTLSFLTLTKVFSKIYLSQCSFSQ